MEEIKANTHIGPDASERLLIPHTYTHQYMEISSKCAKEKTNPFAEELIKQIKICANWTGDRLEEDPSHPKANNLHRRSKASGNIGGSRHSGKRALLCRGSRYSAIGGFNMFPSISRLFLRWRGQSL